MSEGGQGRYRAWGLRVDSALEIPGALRVEERTDEPAELSVRLGDASISQTIRELGPYRLAPEGVLFAMPGVARFLCAGDGRDVVVEREAGAGDGEVESFLIATALPAALWLRGEMVLHGAAAVLPEEKGAVGFLGASGVGKSTLLARLVAQGALAVAEDSLRVWWDGAGWRAAGLPGGAWLHEGEADAERRFEAFAETSCLADAPLRELVILTPGAERARISGVEAMATVLRNRHRARICALAGREAELLPKWAALCASVPLYSACPSHDF